MSAPARPAGRRSLAAWRPARTPLYLLALLAAGAFAYNGARILSDSPPRTLPELTHFDASMPWLGLSLLALVIAAIGLRPVRVRFRVAAVPEFWRAHWLEIVVFAGIFVFGVFMRVYRFQTSLPPSDGICCEEAINGGVAYRALQGQRPLNFLITRWGSAAGFAVFGENTLGLRFFFVVMSIITLVAFYFLLRELVSVPVALFGMALYCAAWWPSLRARQASEGTIYTVLFALVLVRGLKTRSPPLLLCAGVLAGLLSYEYEPFKAAPIIGALFLGAAAGREVLLRTPLLPSAAWSRARALLNAAWRPALIAFMATAVVLIPLIVGTHRGYDLYLTSVHRQEAGRSGERLATNKWRTQLKWEAQIFSPVGPNDYPTSPPRDIPGKDLLDPLTASLGLAGFGAGLVFAFRGYRALFAGWVLVTIGAGALLLSDFGPWKFITLVPVFIVLGAYFLDDARRLISRRFARRGALVFGALLVIGAAFSFWWNANTLFRQVAPSRVVAQSYGGEKAMIYSVCHDLQGRPKGNYAVVYSGDGGLDGFAQRRDSFEAQSRAWGDYIWVCHDLDGSAVPAAEELWPLRDVPPGLLSIVIADPLEKMDGLLAQLARVYPGLGGASRHVIGPGGTFEYVEYNYANPSDLGPSGLSAQYFRSGSVTATRTDAVNDLSWDQAGTPLPPPFAVRWQGLIYYVPMHGTASLHAQTEDPVNVRLDGQTVYDTQTGEQQDAPVALTGGWHTVDILLNKQHAGGNLRLIWSAPGAQDQPVVAQDLFPTAQLTGWVQQRSIGLPGDPGQQVTQRIDFAPHLLSTAPLTAAARTTSSEPILTEERWRGVWHVDAAGDYALGADFPAGTVTLLIDGAQVASEQIPLSGPGHLRATVSLTAGPHAIEVVQQLDTDVPLAGLTWSAFAPGQSEPLQMNVMPY